MPYTSPQLLLSQAQYADLLARLRMNGMGEIINNAWFSRKFLEAAQKLYQNGMVLADSTHLFAYKRIERAVKRGEDVQGWVQCFISLEAAGCLTVGYEKIMQHPAAMRAITENILALKTGNIRHYDPGAKWIYDHLSDLDHATIQELILTINSLRAIGLTLEEIAPLNKQLRGASYREKMIKISNKLQACGLDCARDKDRKLFKIFFVHSDCGHQATFEMKLNVLHEHGYSFEREASLYEEILLHTSFSWDIEQKIYEYTQKRYAERQAAFSFLPMLSPRVLYAYQTETGGWHFTPRALIEILHILLSLAKKYPFHPFFPRNQVIQGVIQTSLSNEPFSVIEKTIATLAALPRVLDLTVIASVLGEIFEHPDVSAWVKELLKQLLQTIHLHHAAHTPPFMSVPGLPLHATPTHFKQLKNSLSLVTLDSPMEKHTSFVHEAILSHPYADQDATYEIMRPTHGIQHASRTAFFVPVFYALYRYFDETTSLTADELKLLQIAALWHDTGRTKDGTDTPESEARSAENFYYYATQVLEIDGATAQQFKQCIIKKDVHDEQRNLKIRLLHDSDCLDIIRSKSFNADYLWFYQLLAQANNGKTLAFQVMARLITEARDLITLSGDHFLDRRYDLKHCFEHAKAWTCLLHLLHTGRYPLLHALYDGALDAGKRMALPAAIAAEDAVTQAFLEGRLLMRGVRAPSYYYFKPGKPMESRAEKEVRKICRRPEMETRSGKLGKFGNRERSLCLLGAGMEPFADAGFLLADLIEEQQIRVRSAVACQTGYGKGEKTLSSPMLKAFPTLPALFQHLQKGGSSYVYERYGVTLVHNEIVASLANVSAIVYAEQSSFHRRASFFKTKLAQHPFVPLLQALFLRYVYAKYYQDLKQRYIQKFGEEAGLQKLEEAFGAEAMLPIYRYTASSNQLKRYPEDCLTDEHIVHLWLTVCKHYLEQNEGILSTLASELKPLNKIKICAVYGDKQMRLSGFRDERLKLFSLDSNYPQLLIKKINTALCQYIQPLLKGANKTPTPNQTLALA